ncbi:MAG TPA: hypothetical protein VN673_15020 [Clostridia bacterium]|nr:hypothetical protein [Clostridia bacterium]
MQSEYVCDTKAWEAFSDVLRNTGFHVQRKGSLATGDLFFDIKARPDAPRGVWLIPSLAQNSGSHPSIKVEMHWAVKSAGPEPLASADVASRLEELLLGCGGVCTYAPVKPALAHKR